MTDSKKDEFEDSFGDAEFAFDDAPDWDDAPDQPKDASAKAGTPADPFQDAFGEDALDEDDDVFAGAVKDASGDGFADADAAPSGDDADGFDFQQMLTPDSVAESTAAQGNPDDEFGDLADGAFGGETFAAADGFDDASGLFDDDPDVPSGDGGLDAEDDPFRDASAADDGAGGVAADPFEAIPNGEGPASEDGKASGTSGRNRFVVPAALAATLAIAYVGYTAVSSMFTSPVAPTVPVVQQDVTPGPAFPSALPGQPGGLDTAQDAHLPAAPSLPSLPEVPAVPSTPSIALPDLAEAPAGSSLPGPDPVELPSVADQPEAPALDDIVGGEGRGGIQAMRDPLPAEPVQDAVPDLSGFEARLSAIEEKVDRLAERIESQASSAPAADVPGLETAPVRQPAPADLAALVPPLKPEIVETATLKGVSRDLAWVSTASGVVEVREGDTIPGAGRVLKIREYEGSWIIVTSNGIVVQ